MMQILKQQLSSYIDKTLIDELLKEYNNLSIGFYIKDNEKILSASGRFVEIVLATLSYINDKKLLNLNDINVESLYQKITNLQKNNGEEELLYLEIPRVARAIYTIRSKKRGAHRKDLDPITQDSVFIKAAADWIVASFIFLYHTKSDKKISQIIDSILEKKIPFIEEFEDGGIVILKKMEFKWQLLLVLYNQNQFLEKRKLKELLRPKYPQLLDTSLRKLEDDKLIYKGISGYKITKLGIQKVESYLIKKD